MSRRGAAVCCNGLLGGGWWLLLQGDLLAHAPTCRYGFVGAAATNVTPSQPQYGLGSKGAKSA
jgi:hypothetical protein